MTTTDIDVDTEWWKVWKNRRYILCLMLNLGILSMYTTRINLSVAIVAMTDTSEDKAEPDFNWTPQMKGYLLSSFFYSYALMQTPAGIIVKHIQPHILYGFAVFISGVLTALMPTIAHHFYVMVIFRILMGFFQAAAVPSIIHFLTIWGPTLERSRMIGICISGAFIGTVLTLPISGIVGELFGWQWIFYVFAAFAFLWCIVWATCISSTPEKDQFISKRELDYINRNLGDGVTDEKLPVPWSEIFTSVPVWSVGLTNFAWGWGFQTMLAQLPPFLRDAARFDLAENGLLSSLPYVTMAVMSWTAGYIADLLLVKGFSVTQVRKCFINTALAIQSVFIIIAAYVLVPGINIFCISMSVGFGAFTYAAIGVNPMDLAPQFAPIIAGLSNTFGTSTGMISPILVGYIVTASKYDTENLRWQWQIVFLISAGIYLIGSVLYWLGGSGEVQTWAKNKPKEKVIGLENPSYVK